MKERKIKNCLRKINNHCMFLEYRGLDPVWSFSLKTEIQTTALTLCSQLVQNQGTAMLRASHFPPLSSPALRLSALKLSLMPTLNFSSSPLDLQLVSVSSQHFFSQTFKSFFRHQSSLSLKRVRHLPMNGHPPPRGTGGSYLKIPMIYFSELI